MKCCLDWSNPTLKSRILEPSKSLVIAPSILNWSFVTFQKLSYGSFNSIQLVINYKKIMNPEQTYEFKLAMGWLVMIMTSLTSWLLTLSTTQLIFLLYCIFFGVYCFFGRYFTWHQWFLVTQHWSFLVIKKTSKLKKEMFIWG